MQIELKLNPPKRRSSKETIDSLIQEHRILPACESSSACSLESLKSTYGNKMLEDVKRREGGYKK